MICPYCRLDVDAEALACCHCQRDLALFSPIAARSERAERGLEALNESIGQVDFGPASAIVGSIILAFLSDYISWLPFAGGWKAVPFQSLAVLAPFIAAIVLGKFSGRTSNISCVTAGIIAGFGGLSAHFIVWAFGSLQDAYNKCVVNHAGSSCGPTGLLPPHWYVSAITYPVAGALLFVSGHAFGRILWPSPFQKWLDGKNIGNTELGLNFRRILEATIGILTAVIPKLIEYAIDASHASKGGARQLNALTSKLLAVCGSQSEI